jgi:hypothetical protein
MLLKLLGGDKKVELIIGFVLIHGQQSCEKMDILKYRWEIIKLILLLFHGI